MCEVKISLFSTILVSGFDICQFEFMEFLLEKKSLPQAMTLFLRSCTLVVHHVGRTSRKQNEQNERRAEHKYAFQQEMKIHHQSKP